MRTDHGIRIEDYAMIGDLGSAALVGRNGSIDWLCWPRFNSDACFSALLGEPEHGRWLIAPKDDAVRVTRRYRPDTLILETRFETGEGAATVIDFMPPRSQHAHLIRIVKGERGKVTFRSELILRFAYGAIVPWVTRIDDTSIRAIAGPDMAILRTLARACAVRISKPSEISLWRPEKRCRSFYLSRARIKTCPNRLTLSSAWSRPKSLDHLGRS